MKTKAMLICACMAASWGCGVEGVVGTDDPELLESEVIDEDSDLELAETPDESLLAGPQDDISSAEAELLLAGDEGSTRQMAATAYQCRRVCGNCVSYARCRQPRLPGGLYTYGDKVRIINRWSKPFHGCVAVIKTSRVWGHVAYVRKRVGSRIYLAEANWARSCPTQRSGTKAGLRITGFWCPRR